MYTKFVKPFADFLCAAILLVMLLPVCAIIVAVYFLHGSASVLFCQQRTGKNGHPFWLFKFRTLKDDTTLSLQDRQFAFGKFLRTTSLDEIPQLVNILKGEMSFIGPRPLPVSYYSKMTAAQKKRYSIKPGITGWAQVNGKNSISWSEKFDKDLFYCNNLSFDLDLQIVFKTVILLLSFKRDVSLNEKPFIGNNNN